jgi:hypothetical protein
MMEVKDVGCVGHHGGIMGACDLWNRAIHTYIAVELFDEFQNRSEYTKSSIESGVRMLGMKQGIWLEKLSLAQFLRQSGTQSLAGRVHREQMEQGWPRLANEVMEICKESVKN